MAGMWNAATKWLQDYVDARATAGVKTTVATPGLDTKVISEKASVAYFLPIKTMTTGNIPKADASDHLIDSGIAYDEIMVEPGAAVAANLAQFTAGKQVEDSGIAVQNTLTNSTAHVLRSDGLCTALGGQAEGATITLGGANTDVSREATIQLKDVLNTNLAVMGGVLIYATGEAGGVDTGALAVRGTDYDTLEVKAANGLQIGPALAGTDKGVLHAVSTAAGVIVITYADATANTSIFLHVVLPNGKVVDSAQFEVGHA